MMHHNNLCLDKPHRRIIFSQTKERQINVSEADALEVVRTIKMTEKY